MSNIFDVVDAESKIGVEFSDKTLLRNAFHHSSYANEKKMKSNENLEFLGDSILNFVIADHLFQKHGEEKEGLLSVMRSNIVSATPLAEAVKRLNLDKHMFYLAGGGKNTAPNENMCADLFEAIVAAIYLDKGLAPARKFIMNALSVNLNQKPQSTTAADYKTKLQEHFQKHKMGVPVYKEISKTGQDNDPVFICAVFQGDKEIGRGSGKKKKLAEQAAAEVAYAKLNSK